MHFPVSKRPAVHRARPFRAARPQLSSAGQVVCATAPSMHGSARALSGKVSAFLALRCVPNNRSRDTQRRADESKEYVQVRPFASLPSAATRALHGLRGAAAAGIDAQRRRCPRATAATGRRRRARRESDRGAVGHGQVPARAQVVRVARRHDDRRSADDRAEGAVRRHARLPVPGAEPAARRGEHRSPPPAVLL